MENKYYIPSIEEFFVGFECEWQSKIRQESWNKQICDIDLINIVYDSFEHSDIEEPSNEQFRVKYLDSSDIEELGFEHIESTENGVNFIKHIDNPKQSIHLTLFNANHRVGIAVYNFNVNPPMVCEEIGTFGGIIKNKSELKKVLNMLNIK